MAEKPKREFDYVLNTYEEFIEIEVYLCNEDSIKFGAAVAGIPLTPDGICIRPVDKTISEFIINDEVRNKIEDIDLKVPLSQEEKEEISNECIRRITECLQKRGIEIVDDKAE